MKSFIDELDLPKDFLFQIISLFVFILIIHTIYLLFIDPAAAKEIAIANNTNVCVLISFLNFGIAIITMADVKKTIPPKVAIA